MPSMSPVSEVVKESIGGVAEIPVLDLGPFLSGERGALEKCSTELRYICETVGFHYVSNHGVPQELIDRTFAEAERFHAQPLDAKMQVPITPEMRGYMPMRGSTTRTSDLSQGNKPNVNEAFFVQRETTPPEADSGKPFRGPNLWPSNLPGFREHVVEYYEALEGLAVRMLPIYAAALNLPIDFFSPGFQRPMGVLRLTHYPVSQYSQKEFALAPHTDSSFLTILAQNKVPGLQILTRRGIWIDAPVIEGTFVINSGDILRRWTNDRFLSTPHRAFNTSGTPRYAIPYFCHPDPDYVMECLPTCLEPDRPQRYPAETSADYMTWFAGRNYDHVRQQSATED
jgi:isopenicillin N synthase-like dioxygenase